MAELDTATITLIVYGILFVMASLFTIVAVNCWEPRDPKEIDFEAVKRYKDEIFRKKREGEAAKLQTTMVNLMEGKTSTSFAERRNQRNSYALHPPLLPDKQEYHLSFSKSIEEKLQTATQSGHNRNDKPSAMSRANVNDLHSYSQGIPEVTGMASKDAIASRPHKAVTMPLMSSPSRENRWRMMHSFRKSENESMLGAQREEEEMIPFVTESVSSSSYHVAPNELQQPLVHHAKQRQPHHHRHLEQQQHGLHAADGDSDFDDLDSTHGLQHPEDEEESGVSMTEIRSSLHKFGSMKYIGRNKQFGQYQRQDNSSFSPQQGREETRYPSMERTESLLSATSSKAVRFGSTKMINVVPSEPPAAAASKPRLNSPNLRSALRSPNSRPLDISPIGGHGTYNSSELASFSGLPPALQLEQSSSVPHFMRPVSPSTAGSRGNSPQQQNMSPPSRHKSLRSAMKTFGFDDLL